MQSSTSCNGYEVVVQEQVESSNVNQPHVPAPVKDINDESSKCEAVGVLPSMGGVNPNKKTLVLDLDGTLVHSSTTPIPTGYHFSITFEGHERPSYYVLKRPGVDDLLQQLGATGLYEIVLFTAASKEYSDAMVDMLLDSLPAIDSRYPNKNRDIIPPTHRLSISHCAKVEGVLGYMKDLSVLGRDLKNVIFADSFSSSYHLQPKNAIPINPWKGEDFGDKAIFKILSFCVDNVYSTSDVRDLISKDSRFGVVVQEQRKFSNVDGPHAHLNNQSFKCEAGSVLPPMGGGDPNKKTLVLDLDGTLVHASRTPIPTGYHFSITFEGHERPSYYVLKRPGVDDLLQQLGATGLYEIVLFTSASRDYADAIVEKLLDSLPTDFSDINNNRDIIPPTHRLVSSHCKKVEGVSNEVKDLSMLGRDLEKVIFVDHNSSSYHLQPENAIPINFWEGKDFGDKTIFKILSFCLQNVDSTSDVRELISNDPRFGVVVQEERESSNVHLNNESWKSEAGGILPSMEGGNPNKKTLVLDLDGTLVHVTNTPMPAGYHFPITFKGRKRPSYYVFKRPGVDDLLEQLGATGLYEIVVFTAASRDYADNIVSNLLNSLPGTETSHITDIIPPTHILARSHCKKVEGVLNDVKDLSILGRDLKKVIFVDDRSTSYYLQPKNAIPINCWEGEDFGDGTIFKILSFCLENADSTSDVRELISNDPRFEVVVEEQRESSNVNGVPHVPVPLNANNSESSKYKVLGVLPPMGGENPNKKTLVLDLNGTLVHSSRTPIPTGYHFSITFEGRETPSYYVLKRPGVDDLLEQLGATGLYEIVLFTGASKECADAFVDRLLDSLPAIDRSVTNKNRDIIPPTHRLYFSHCTEVEEVPDYVKDLSVLGRDLKNVIFVDSHTSSYHFQPKNAIPIHRWEGEDFGDKAIFKILNFCLENASSTSDVRELISKDPRFGRYYPF